MSSFKTKKIATKAPIFAPVLKEPEWVEISSLQEDPIITPKKKFFSWKRLSVFIIFVGLLAGGCFAAQKFFASNTQNGSQNFHPSIASELLASKPKGTTNILIAWIGWKGHDGADLTDSIMLASLNEDSKKVTLLSIPRDLYIAYPGWKGAGRINSLYDIGMRDKVWIQYLADKVSEITGQPIDHYMVIDFSGFKQIVDILWGIQVDVPNDLIDHEYPDGENDRYITFSIKKWLQKLNGDTALKYARSRHSTSDFDRSTRQQLIIKAIKEKALSLGYITNPQKLWELYGAVISHLDTDMSLANMASYGLTFHDVSSENIWVVSLTNECVSIQTCVPGSFLYTPSRDLFGGASVILPENAEINHVSYYDDIKRFVGLTFAFPAMRSMEKNLVIIFDPTEKKRASDIANGLAKLGFPFSLEKPLQASTGSIENSHINIYWHSDIQIGIDPESAVIQALKHIESAIPYTIVDRNEYVNTQWPKIEIVIGKDIKDYFSFLKAPYYVPTLTKEVVSGEKIPTKTISWWTNTKTGTSSQNNTKIPKKTPPKNINTPTGDITSSSLTVEPGEWENF